MARSVQEIFNIMRSKGIADATDAGHQDVVDMYNNTSIYAVWRNVFYAVAYCTWLLEVIFEDFVQVVLDIIERLTPHTKKWYRQKFLSFLYGVPLLIDSDKFNTSGFTAEQLANARIVKYVAVNEATINQIRSLEVKLAKANAQTGRPEPLSTPQLAAITAYAEEIKDAGVNVVIYNRSADVIKAVVNVYYNPLLLDNLGNRLDGGGKPIEAAANNYLFNLGFNGEFIVARFEDAIQQTYGISRNRVDVLVLQKKTGNNAYVNVASSFIPDAGFCEFEANGLTINYIADVVG
jgi:hypothetical protein